MGDVRSLSKLLVHKTISCYSALTFYLLLSNVFWDAENIFLQNHLATKAVYMVCQLWLFVNSEDLRMLSLLSNRMRQTGLYLVTFTGPNKVWRLKEAWSDPRNFRFERLILTLGCQYSFRMFEARSELKQIWNLELRQIIRSWQVALKMSSVVTKLFSSIFSIV